MITEPYTDKCSKNRSNNLSLHQEELSKFPEGAVTVFHITQLEKKDAHILRRQIGNSEFQNEIIIIIITREDHITHWNFSFLKWANPVRILSSGLNGVDPFAVAVSSSAVNCLIFAAATPLRSAFSLATQPKEKS